jgi:hypothetical protein
VTSDAPKSEFTGWHAHKRKTRINTVEIHIPVISMGYPSWYY